MNNVLFGSDYHLGHASILKYTRRGELWSSIEAHDADIIKSHNMAVQPNDDVYLIGDIAMYKSQWDCAKAIEQLNGRKHLVYGNHDREFVKFYQTSGLFDNVVLMDELKWNKKFVVMCHHPVAYWHNAERGGWMLHGHFHGDYDYEKYGLNKGRILDVGLDALAALRVSMVDEEHRAGLYRPIALDTVETYFAATKRENMPARHGKID